MLTPTAIYLIIMKEKKIQENCKYEPTRDLHEKRQAGELVQIIVNINTKEQRFGGRMEKTD